MALCGGCVGFLVVNLAQEIMIAIQTTIVGYSGKPCTLFSAYDQESQVLVVSVEAAYRRDRRDGCMVITNDDNIERDGLFSEEDLQTSITSYFSMLGSVALDGKSSRVVFADKAARANPAQSIEKDGMDSSGQRYRIAETITSAQIAALATCWYTSSRVNTIDKMLIMADKLLDIELLNRGGILTI